MRQLINRFVQSLQHRKSKVLVVVILFAILINARVSSGQDMAKITQIKVVYWRAFHGTIEQEVGKDPSGVLYLTTYLYKPGSQSADKPKVITQDISQKVLSQISQFAGDPDMRKSFAKTEPIVQPDGSKIEVTVRENNFGVVFVTQNAFSPNAPEANRRLGIIVLSLIKQAGITIAKEELY